LRIKVCNVRVSVNVVSAAVCICVLRYVMCVFL